MKEHEATTLSPKKPAVIAKKRWPVPMLALTTAGDEDSDGECRVGYRGVHRDAMTRLDGGHW